jgi:uncharacterized membrane protein
MNHRIRLVPRIALLAALIYVLSWGTSLLPNINLIFFFVFIAGFTWGTTPGIITGGLGMALWTIFNPYGPAATPVMLAQIIGASLSGPIGSFYRNHNLDNKSKLIQNISLIIAALCATVFYYLPVNLVDAWVFQPFVPRFVTGMAWSLISIVGNAIIFPLLFAALKPFLLKEKEIWLKY